MAAALTRYLHIFTPILQNFFHKKQLTGINTTQMDLTPGEAFLAVV